MLVHNLQAIKRNIKFMENVNVQISVRASEHCCWNCLWSDMDYENLWCEREMNEVDFRDLCTFWEGQ